MPSTCLYCYRVLYKILGVIFWGCIFIVPLVHFTLVRWALVTYSPYIYSLGVAIELLQPVTATFALPLVAVPMLLCCPRALIIAHNALFGKRKKVCNDFAMFSTLVL
jgi:hypothetical protein